jgi:hypothetical protein
MFQKQELESLWMTEKASKMDTHTPSYPNMQCFDAHTVVGMMAVTDWLRMDSCALPEEFVCCFGNDFPGYQLLFACSHDWILERLIPRLLLVFRNLERLDPGLGNLTYSELLVPGGGAGVMHDQCDWNSWTVCRKRRQ